MNKICLILGWVFIANVNFANAAELYGSAYSEDEKTLLYYEKHKIQVSPDGFNQLVETQYLDKDKNEFATLRSDFSKSQFVPDSLLVDRRGKLQESLTLIGDKAEIKITVNGKQEPLKVIETNPDFVAGQGFNNYLLKYFDELINGKVKKVNFVVIPLQDYFHFEAKLKKSNETNDGSVDFKVAIASLFLKAFADPIYVKYDRKTKALLEFRGLSNLNNEKGKKQNVVIKYSPRP